jgi:hypothetical protein
MRSSDLQLKLTLSLFFSALCIGCAAGSPGNPFPFSIDLAGSRAYYGSDFLSVYLVGPQDVLVVRFDLPAQKKTALRLRVTDGKSSIVHYSGSGITRYVLPMGPALPFPPDYKYSYIAAQKGLILCQNPPAAGDFSSLGEVILSLEGVDFGDGALYHLEPIRLKIGVYPP